MIVLDVVGMTCQGCEKAVHKAISSEDSGAAVFIDRSAGRVSVDTRLSAEQAVAAVEAAGYDAAVATPDGAVS